MMEFEPFPIWLDRLYAALPYVIVIAMFWMAVSIVCIKIFDHIDKPPEA